MRASRNRRLELPKNFWKTIKPKLSLERCANRNYARRGGSFFAQEDLLISRTNVAQQETVLKNALSRNGVESVWLDEVRVIPLDHIEVPTTERPSAHQRSDQAGVGAADRIEQGKIGMESSQIMLKGTKNALLPAVSGFVDLTNNGLAGPASSIYNHCCGAPDAFFIVDMERCSVRFFSRNFQTIRPDFP